MMSLMLAASVAMALDQEIYVPMRIDCDLVSIRHQDKSDKRTLRLTLLYPFEATKVETGFQIFALTTLDDGRTWIKPVSASGIPDLQRAWRREPQRAYLATLDFGDGSTATIRSGARGTSLLSYDSRSMLTDGAGAILTRGSCRMTREVESK